MATTGSTAYLRTQIMTAPPEKLQLMLYEGAIRFAGQAKEKMTEGNFEGSCELLIRAEDIVMELICGLRHDLNPELCARMGAVYSFIYRKLVDANVQRDTAAIDDAVRVLTIQRDIWLELLDKLARERAAEPSGAGVSA
jgi:flagellar secretion chaperone FliS